MDNKSDFSHILRIATIHYAKIIPFALQLQNGSVVYVLDAPFIRAIADTIGFSSEIHLTPDGEFGEKLPSGLWTGMTGMLQRGDVDMSIGYLPITEERLETVSFSFPYYQNEMTFITNKLQPQPVGSILFNPFPFNLWVALITSLFIVPLFISKFMKGKLSYLNILHSLCGTLIGQPINFKIQTSSIRLVVFSWILCAFILSNGYKAVISSVLAFPTFTGIKNYADLTRATSQRLVKCYSMKGTNYYSSLLHSGDESMIEIANCLNLTENPYIMPDDFRSITGKKVFFSAKWSLSKYEDEYYLSKDFLSRHLIGIAVPKAFCCMERLNIVIHRIAQSGLMQKYYRDIKHILILRKPRVSHEESYSPNQISLQDIEAAFFLLVFGYTLATAILFLEFFSKRKNFRNCYQLRSTDYRRSRCRRCLRTRS